MSVSRDVISGALEIEQSTHGYRFGLDAVLLATDLPELPRGAQVTELGAGQGAVSLSIASRRADVQVTAIELQSSLWELLRRNVEANGLTDRVVPVHADLRDRDKLSPHSADLVVTNPPYHRVGHGRPCPDPERAAARSELNGTIADFVSAAQYLAKPGGYLKLVLPPLRMFDLQNAVEVTDFRPVSVRYVHPRQSEDAYLMEWVFKRGGAPDLAVRSPLFVRDPDAYCDEVQHRLRTAAVELP